MTRFSFVNTYSVLETDENPLLTGVIDNNLELERRSSVGLDMAALRYEQERRKGRALHIDLADLVHAKKAFQEELDDVDGSMTPATELTLPQFVDAFSSLVDKSQHEQLGYLFMKIDCNCDGRVSWDELLTFVMSQDRNEQKVEVHDAHLARAELPDCPQEDAHREPASCIVFAPKCNAYVSGGRDGTMHVWTTGLKLETTVPIADKTEVNAMAVLSGTLGKLAVASSDGMISLYELQEYAGSKRWSLYGKISLDDMPICLLAFKHVADDAPCLAVGTDAGVVRIFDAKQLLSCFKNDDLRKEMVKGAIPLRIIVDTTVIITLPLHADWVNSLAYEQSLAALVSGSMDSTLRVTQLDWPPTAVPSSKAAHDSSDDALLRADPAHCRNISTIRAHAKGVTSFQLITMTSRRLCATCSYERDALIWNLETGDLIKSLVGHRQLLRQVAYDDSSQVLVTLDVAGEMRTWEMHGFSLVQIIRSPTKLECITAVAFNPAQECLVTANRRLQIWQHPRKTATAEVIKASTLAPQGHKHPLVAAVYSHQFYLLVSGDESGRICVWDIKTGRQNFSFEHGSRLTAMALDGTGRKLIAGGADGSVSLWNFSSGERLKSISSKEAPGTEVTQLLHVELVKLSFYVSVGWDRDAWLWSDRDKSPPRRLKGHTDDILCAAFCPPNLLVTGAYDGTLIVHNVETGAMTRRVPPRRPEGSSNEKVDSFLHSCSIEAMVALDPERRLLPDCALVCGSADGFLRIYSSSSMRLLDEVRVCESSSDGVHALCTEDSATFVVTGDTKGRIKVYDVSELARLWPTTKELSSSSQKQHSVLQSRSLKLLCTWRAHTHAITHVEFCVGVEGLVSASNDCTLRLWTLLGEQVGIFGQSDTWSLSERTTWFDASCHSLEGIDHNDDKVAASEKRLKSLKAAPNPGPSQQKYQSTAATGSSRRNTNNLYRVQPTQLDQIEQLSKALSKVPKAPEQLPPSNASFDPLPPGVTGLGGLRRADQLLPRLAPSSSAPVIPRAARMWKGVPDLDVWKVQLPQPQPAPQPLVSRRGIKLLQKGPIV